MKMNVSRKGTIKKLQQMAEDSPFTVVKCGEALQQLVVKIACHQEPSVTISTLLEQN